MASMMAESLALDISPRADAFGSEGRDGGGEDMMQDFVRLHMMSILQPFAERLRELQEQAQDLASELRQDRETADARGIVLDRHEEEVASLRAGESRQTEQLQTYQAELAALKKEKNRLEGNHEMTKAALGAAKDTLAKMSSAVEMLQQSAREGSERQGGLDDALGALERSVMEQLETRLDKQGRVCKELNERQAQLDKACQQARTFAENANLAIKKLSGAYESRKQEDDEASAGLRERTAQIESRLHDVDRSLREHAEGISSTEREIQHLRTWTGQLEHVKGLLTQQAEFSDLQHAQTSRLNRVENDIAEIVSAAAAERTLQKEEIDALEQRFSTSLSDVLKLRDKHRAHADLISTTARRVEELETSHRALADRSAQADRELGSIDAWRRDATAELRQQSLSIGAAEGQITRVTNGLEAAGTNLRDLRSEQSADREALAGLGSRLDLCCRYFNGLGKGLQDTHRQITGGESMLPPKLAGGGPPALPTLPRAPKASLPSPRSSTPRGAMPGIATPRGSLHGSSTPRHGPSTPRSVTPQRLR